MNRAHPRLYVAPQLLLFYFLAGGLTGATVALLLAPQSGRATREMMRRSCATPPAPPATSRTSWSVEAERSGTRPGIAWTMPSPPSPATAGANLPG